MNLVTTKEYGEKYILTVTFDKEEWTNAQEKAFKKLSKDVTIKGFRKGKAPEEMLRSAVPGTKVINEAIDSLLQKGYEYALNESKLLPVIRPIVDVKDVKEDALVVAYTIVCRPAVKLGKYKDLEVEPVKFEVSEEDIDEAIKGIQEKNATMTIVSDRAAQMGDSAGIDFTGYLDGKPFDGGSAQNYVLVLGSNTFVPGFEEQIVGMNLGEEKDINITFPENYYAELAGKAVVFHVKLNQLRVKELPAIDDDLAIDADIKDVNTLEELRAHFKNQLAFRKEAESRNATFAKVVEQITLDSTVEIADELLEVEVNANIENTTKRLAEQGATMEDYLLATSNTMESLRENVKASMKKEISVAVVADEIIKVEGLEVKEEELKAYVEEEAKKYNMTGEEFTKALKGNLEYFYNNLKNKKLFDFLKANNKF